MSETPTGDDDKGAAGLGDDGSGRGVGIDRLEDDP